MNSVYCVRVGRLGGSWAHPILALAYAKYLSTALHYEVNEVFLRYKSGDASLADDVLQRAPAKDNEWAGVRALVRVKRNELTEVLQEHEVTKPPEFARVTNATYRGLTGKTAKQIKVEKGLKPKANLRDAMTTKELVFVMAAEQLAKERIEDEDARGVIQCESAANKSAASLKLQETEIHWPVIDVDGLSAKDHSTSASLQFADIAASAIAAGVEPDLYGNCEARYSAILKPLIYHRNGNYLSYGVKTVPDHTNCGLTEAQLALFQLFT